ncbi:MAG TPA: hypothetical protein VNO14_00865 [Blastocatellia bacterium]|nr:hypothetical protein [Blastocatellia bacterium]
MDMQRLWPGMIALTAILRLCSTIFISSQAMTDMVVPLQINQQYDQKPMVAWIEFEQNPLPGSSSSRLGKAPGGTLVKMEPVFDQPHSYRIVVDSNADRDLSNDSPYIIHPDSTIPLTVRRKWKSDEEQVLPYSITYSRQVSKDGKVKEIFYWRPRY